VSSISDLKSGPFFDFFETVLLPLFSFAVFSTPGDIGGDLL
jgi:hypothetical protein